MDRLNAITSVSMNKISRLSCYLMCIGRWAINKNKMWLKKREKTISQKLLLSNVLIRLSHLMTIKTIKRLSTSTPQLSNFPERIPIMCYLWIGQMCIWRWVSMRSV